MIFNRYINILRGSFLQGVKHLFDHTPNIAAFRFQTDGNDLGNRVLKEAQYVDLLSHRIEQSELTRCQFIKMNIF